MFSKVLIDSWNSIPEGYAKEIEQLSSLGYKAWAVRSKVAHGVAVLYPRIDMEVREGFSGVDLYTEKLPTGHGPDKVENCLILMSSAPIESVPFTTLCSEFVSPGPDGSQRDALISNPIGWWAEWKELLGNKNVDERVYDTLGELLVLKYLAEHGNHAEWNGPDCATYDIDSESSYFEVKSTTARKSRCITLSNRFQLVPPEGASLSIVLCQFEKALAGYCIDDLVVALGSLGYNTSELNARLDKLGLERGKSARRRYYMLHDMVEYRVDESFPAIRDSSFVGGVLPKCIQSFTYTLSLDGVQGTSLLEG